MCAVTVSARRLLCNTALVIIGAFGFQEQWRCTPAVTVRAHQKNGIWCAIAKEVRTLGVFDKRSTHCRKRWEDLHHWARKTAEAQLGLASRRGRGARHTLTPLMFCILTVAYLELDGRLKASQQPQRASSGGEAEAPVMEGAASHMGLEAESTDGEGTSGTEGKGSTTTERRGQYQQRLLLRWKLPGGGGQLCAHPNYRYSRHPT
ncbi:hypothetical protein NDU88_003843 [Pleurodeles waltl]|uniref:Myb-like domain-containing protein n=1 Tax=Pleurodeles waltl TaxID=8319 RepID=A0AAV7W7C2_PLEWA|nr:hypothetical protein NDU88_003843 [Pleurodeles waltl]